MSLESLLESMAREAQAHQEEIRGKADAEAARIIAEAHAKATARYTAALKALELELALLERQERDRADAEAARHTFAEEDALVCEAVAGARARLAEMARQPGFERVLEALLDEVVRLADSVDDVTVRVPAAHADTLRAAAARLGLKEDVVALDPALTDGVVLEDRAGAFRITDRLSERLNRLSGEARTAAHRVLFEPGRNAS